MTRWTRIEKAVVARNFDEIPKLMSDRWLSDVTLYGSVRRVREGLEAWFDAGVRTPILVPSSAAGNQIKAFEELFSLLRLTARALVPLALEALDREDVLRLVARRRLAGEQVRLAAPAAALARDREALTDGQHRAEARSPSPPSRAATRSSPLKRLAKMPTSYTAPFPRREIQYSGCCVSASIQSCTRATGPSLALRTPSSTTARRISQRSEASDRPLGPKLRREIRREARRAHVRGREHVAGTPPASTCTRSAGSRARRSPCASAPWRRSPYCRCPSTSALGRVMPMFATEFARVKLGT